MSFARLVALLAVVAALLVPVAPARGEPVPAAGLKVGEVTVQSLPVAERPQPLMVQLVLGGIVADVLLEPVSVRGAGFSLRASDERGVYEVDIPAEMTFAGSVVGRAGSAARMSVVNGSWRGVVELGGDRSGVLWWVQPLSDSEAGAAADRHVVFAGSAVLPDGFGCEGGVATGLESATAKGAPGPLCARVAEIAFDADVLFYQQNGSSMATATADIESVVNAMNLIYARDMQVSFVITTTIVRTAAGLYTSTSTGTLLNQMQAEWTANQGAVVRDLAHLMTGQPTGSTIGLAYSGAVCST